MKISGVYKITNTVTNGYCIGSSKNIKRRWKDYKLPSEWKKQPNNPLYHDMKKYGVEKFAFDILCEVEPEQLKKIEQQFIEKMHPVYNKNNAKGCNIERYKEYQKSDKYKECKNKYQNQLCYYNGEIIKLNTLRMRLRKTGIEHPTQEARKYLLDK